MSTTNNDRLLREFARASENLRKGLPTASGGVSAEVAYGVAYAALVRAGLAPKLRGKYRRRVTGR